MNLAKEQAKSLSELSNELICIAKRYREILDMKNQHPWKHLWECLLLKNHA